MLLSSFVLYCIFCFHLKHCTAEEKIPDVSTGLNVSPKEKQEILPPCQACRTLTNSFKKGMEETSRGKFDGGDTLWEESRLGTYADSEIRLVEIQEKLCSDIGKGSEQCQRLAEEHESLIEEWWFKKKDIPDIFYFLCVDSLQVCCPENHFGSDCRPCLGGIVNSCSGHGQCKGAGTRKGSGECRCDAGYTGNLCDQCKIGYYNETNDATKGGWTCEKCDRSCKDHCRKAGPRACEVCADGFQYATDLGCIDQDECVDSPLPACKKGSFCVNTIGSYRCIDCHKFCNTCRGDGPDMCDKCADGYVMKNNICIEKKSWKTMLQVDFTRYSTYIGLCVATYIVFRRNVYIASVIGVVVAIYIGLSEYTVGEWDKNSLAKSIKSFLFL